jgi:DNA-binding MarR family transcriptional regulator
MADQVPPAVTEAECSVIEGLFQMERRVARQVSAALAEADATVDEWRLLRLLGDDVPRLMGEIARSLCMPDASVTRLVSGLAERSFVYRRQSESDRRRASVHLSRQGAARREKLDAIVTTHQDALLHSPEWASALVDIRRLLPDEAFRGSRSELRPETTA